MHIGVTSLVIHKQILRRREANSDQFLSRDYVTFPNNNHANCEKLFLTCQQHRSTLRVVTPIWPPLASIMHISCVIQLINFPISGRVPHAL